MGDLAPAEPRNPSFSAEISLDALSEYTNAFIPGPGEPLCHAILRRDQEPFSATLMMQAKGCIPNES